MCNWSPEERIAYEDSLKLLFKDEVRFDALILRDMMRGKSSEPILYGDVFSELWHFYRKGGFSKRYIIATKNVLDAQGKLETTVQYLPAKVWLTQPSREDMRREDEKVKRAARRRNTSCGNTF